MISTLLGKKIGMTQVYDAQNVLVPVTVVEAGPCPVVQVKTTETDGYNAVQYDLQVLAKQAQMGSSPYAYKVAEFNVKVAAGDEQSLIPNLELMKQGFEQAREALDIARRNYRETEDVHAQTFAKLNEHRS